MGSSRIVPNCVVVSVCGPALWCWLAHQMILDGFNKNGVKTPSIGMTQDPQDHGATWRDQIFKAMFWGDPPEQKAHWLHFIFSSYGSGDIYPHQWTTSHSGTIWNHSLDGFWSCCSEIHPSSFCHNTHLICIRICDAWIRHHRRWVCSKNKIQVLAEKSR